MVAGGEDGIDGVAAYVLDGGEAETNSCGAGGEVGAGNLHVGRLDGDAHFAALLDVLDHVFGLGNFRAQQRRHELYRVVGLEIGGVVGQQGVGRGVRLVEAVAGELLHQIEDADYFVFGVLALEGSLDKAGALLGHLLGIFFAHGAAKQIGFAQGVAGEHVGDLHDLLLVDDDSQRLLEQGFEFGQFVADDAAAPLALDEVVDHAALDRAGTVEGVEGG